MSCDNELLSIARDLRIGWPTCGDIFLGLFQDQSMCPLEGSVVVTHVIVTIVVGIIFVIIVVFVSINVALRITGTTTTSTGRLSITVIRWRPLSLFQSIFTVLTGCSFREIIVVKTYVSEISKRPILHYLCHCGDEHQ